MTALANGRQMNPLAGGHDGSIGQKGNTIVFAGGIVMADASNRGIPGATVAGAIAIGVALTNRGLDRYDATASGPLGVLADNVQKVRFDEGVFPMFNSGGGDAVLSTTRFGTPLWVVDDQTVALTSGGGTRSPAGRFYGIEPSGQVLVEISRKIGAELAQLAAVETAGGFLQGAQFRALKNVPGHNGAGACAAAGAKVGDIVLGVSFAKVPSAAATTQAGLTAFESVITIADQIQQSGAADLHLEAFDVLLLAQS